jgi:hypothetical protein
VQDFKCRGRCGLIVFIVRTSPRQKSDDRTSVGLKCFRANVDFPAPDGPTSTTSANSGIVITLLKLNSFTLKNLLPQKAQKAQNRFC